MEITLDFTPEVIAHYAWLFLINGFWVVVLFFFVRWLVRKLWKDYLKEIQGNYAKSIDKVLLAVRVPKQTEQTPKAVENFFSHLTGLYSGTGDLVDQYIKGKIQENFAVEIVAREGTIQYCVHTPVKFRDVIEAAIFAQYPDAEIIQVSDYTAEVPASYPDEHYDLWGTELTLVKPFPFPLKTYAAFEHQLPGSFKDPLASLLEFLGTLKDREQVWIQFALLPTTDEWQDASKATVDKLIGVKPPPPKQTLAEQVVGETVGFLRLIVSNVFGTPPPAAPAAKAADAPNQMQYLSPGDRVVVEQVQIKASKPGFAAKIRIVYLAPKEIFNKGKIAAGVIGAFKQYGSSNLNGFKPEPNSKVAAGYFHVAKTIAEKQNTLMGSYAKRSMGGGGKPYILNVEELATLWHFPTIETKAPLISKSEFKKAEPPGVLPMRQERPISRLKKSSKSDESLKDGDLPGNLPFA